MRFSLCGFLIIKPQTALHNVVRCTITCMRLCHFAGSFGVFLQFMWFGEHLHIHTFSPKYTKWGFKKKKI